MFHQYIRGLSVSVINTTDIVPANDGKSVPDASLRRKSVYIVLILRTSLIYNEHVMFLFISQARYICHFIIDEAREQEQELNHKA